MEIFESDMNFGPYNDADVFYIEKSQLYNNIGDFVKTCEFVLKKHQKLVFIEAKTTAPNPESDNPQRFPEYITEIAQKLHNSLELFLSAKLNFINDSHEELTNFISMEDISDISIAFRLIVKNAEPDWLIPIQDALQQELIAQMNIWNLSVAVLNEAKAKEYNLIS